MMMELRKVRLKPMTTDKPKIIKYESLEPKIVKSDIDKIEFLQDQIREYKRQIKILKKALEEAKKKGLIENTILK